MKFSTILLSCTIFMCASVNAQDSWTGKDKFKHFGTEVGVGLFVKSFIIQDDDIKAVIFASVPGFVKECGDPKFSVKDLVWDIAGAYVGVKLGGLVVRKNFIGVNISLQ